MPTQWSFFSTPRRVTVRSVDDIASLTERLIAIDSSNPSMGDGPGESEIAAFVVEWAAASGLRAEVVEETPGRPSVVVRGGRGSGGRRLLLCGHLDTVGLADVIDPLSSRWDGNSLYGRGAYDMKGALAAALIVCRESDRAGIEGEVIVAAVSDEEFASLGIREILPGLGADAAVVVEPTELEIATMHRGFVWMEIEVEGKAAHGSRPHLGVDAIAKTGPILVALAALNAELMSQPHPQLGPANIHASMITGGVEESTIPGRCLLTVERRTLPGESIDDVEREIGDLLDACRAADPELRVVYRVTMERQPLETDSDADIVEALIQSTNRVLGSAAPVGAVSYWADSAFISAAGIPTVLFGPVGDGAHADEEWVDMDSVSACVRVLSDLALEFCR
jgi:acetylornithine deacetylase